MVLSSLTKALVEMFGLCGSKGSILAPEVSADVWAGLPRKVRMSSSQSEVSKRCPNCVSKKRLDLFRNPKVESRFLFWHKVSIVLPSAMLIVWFVFVAIHLFSITTLEFLAIIVAFIWAGYSAVRGDRIDRNKMKLILYKDKAGCLHLHEKDKVIINPLDYKLYTMEKELIEGQIIVIQTAGKKFDCLMLDGNKWVSKWPYKTKGHTQVKMSFEDCSDEENFEEYLKRLSFDYVPFDHVRYGFLGLKYESLCYFYSRELNFFVIMEQFEKFKELRVLYDVLWRFSSRLEGKVEETKEITGSPVGVFVREYLHVLNSYTLSQRSSNVDYSFLRPNSTVGQVEESQRRKKEKAHADELLALLPEYKTRSQLRAEREGKTVEG